MSDNTKKLGLQPVIVPVGEIILGDDGTRYYGMSKRFYAACAAMQGFVSNPNNNLTVYNMEINAHVPNPRIIQSAFELADALLKEEGKQ